MTMVEVAPSTLKKVKECVDFIFEATSPEGGFAGSLNNNGTRFGYMFKKALGTCYYKDVKMVA